MNKKTYFFVGSFILFYVVFSLAFSTHASAATYYISTTGNDNNLGGVNTPFKTWGTAFEFMQAGDTLYVQSGTYPGIDNVCSSSGYVCPGTTVRSGTSWNNPITIAAAAGAIVTVPYIQFGYNARYIVVDGINVDGQGYQNEGVLNEGVWIGNNTHHIRIKNLEIKNAFGQGVLVGTDFNEFINLNIHDNGWGFVKSSLYGKPLIGMHIHGIYIEGANNLIENSLVYKNTGYGIHVFNSGGSSTSGNIVRNNTVYDNGLAHDGSTAGIIISSGSNNIAYGNNVYGNQDGISVYNCANCKVFNNSIHNNDKYSEGFAAISISNSSGTIVENNILSSNSKISDNGNGSSFSGNWCDAVGVGCAVVGTTPPSSLPNAPSCDSRCTGGTPPPTTSCPNLWNSSLAVPTNFGASYNLFSTAKELLMSVFCSGSNSASVTIGNGTQTEYIYKTGYTWTNNQWTPFDYSGSNKSADGNWIIGRANHTLNVADLTQKQSVLAYICEWTGTVWKCGCRSNACANNFWNLQQFKK